MASVLFLLSAAAYALIAIPLSHRVQKHGDIWTALQYTIGAWPNTRWLDLVVVSSLIAIGTALLVVGFWIIFRPRS